MGKTPPFLAVIKIWEVGTPSKNEVYAPKKLHAKFGAFIRRVTIIEKIDLKRPDYNSDQVV